MPLPKYISRELMDDLALNPTGNLSLTPELRMHASEWYLLDENHCPPRYELKPLKRKDVSSSLSSTADNLVDPNHDFWTNILPSLRDFLLNSLLFEATPSSHENGDLFIGRSVTEWETIYALSLAFYVHSNQQQQETDRSDGCLWIQRFFEMKELQMMLKEAKDVDERIAVSAVVANLCDVLDDPSKRKKLELLRMKMTSILEPRQRIVSCSKVISPLRYLSSSSHQPQPGKPTVDEGKLAMNEKNDESETEDVLQEWKSVVTKSLFHELNTVRFRSLQRKHYLQTHYRSFPLDHMNEILHHFQLTISKASLYHGREELIDHALHLIMNISSKYRSSLRNVSLGIIGKSGSGKTSLLSKLALRLAEDQQIVSQNQTQNQNINNQEQQQQTIPVMIRYCGTSRYSLHGKDLIQIFLCNSY
jgi:hypothetical protein